jgi:flagellar basal-body rod modification protein FlgD
MTSISAVNSKNLPVLSKDMAQKQLGQSDFLRLMTTQLKQQDPLDPVDNRRWRSFLPLRGFRR